MKMVMDMLFITKLNLFIMTPNKENPRSANDKTKETPEEYAKVLESYVSSSLKKLVGYFKKTLPGVASALATDPKIKIDDLKRDPKKIKEALKMKELKWDIFESLAGFVPIDKMKFKNPEATKTELRLIKENAKLQALPKKHGIKISRIIKKPHLLRRGFSVSIST